MNQHATINPKRGLTVLELLLAIAVTAMVGAAIAGMLGAVSFGVDGRRDHRAFMVQANAAQMRLNAYIMPSRCILAQQGGDLILWFDDSRKSNTVHVSEVRWLLYDSEVGVIEALRVEFPEHWSEAERQLVDREFPADTDWYAVFAAYDSQGWVSGYDLVDGMQAVSITLDKSEPLDSRHVSYRLTFEGKASTLEMTMAAVIQKHRTPDY